MIPDLRFAFRSLLKTPGFSIVAVLTVGVAIAACTSLFSVLQAVVLRPLPYPEPDSLVSIWAINKERQLEVPALSWAKYEAYRERTDVFAGLGMCADNGFTLTEGTGDPEQVFGMHASANLLPLLGIQPVRGRQFTAEEDVEGGPRVAMISHQLWQNRFSGDAEIIGRVVQIDGVAREIVGILPERMPVPFNRTSVVVPSPRELPYLTPQQLENAIVYTAYGRLAAGVTLEAAKRHASEMAAQFKAANPARIDANNDSDIRTVSQQVLGDIGRQFWTLAGAVALVLLIACANIANLFLARVSARHKEIGVRMALGANARDIIKLILRSGATQVGLGLALGLAGAFAASQLLQQALYEIKPFDPTIFAAVAIFFALVAALACVIPARRAVRIDPMVALRAE